MNSHRIPDDRELDRILTRAWQQPADGLVDALHRIPREHPRAESSRLRWVSRALDAAILIWGAGLLGVLAIPLSQILLRIWKPVWSTAFTEPASWPAPIPTFWLMLLLAVLFLVYQFSPVVRSHPHKS